MNEANVCRLCGKTIDEGLELCEYCKIEAEIKQFEKEIEM